MQNEAQREWALTPIAKRTAWLEKFKKLLVKNCDAVVQAIQNDTDKPEMEAYGIELAAVLLTADYYLKNAAKILSPRRATLHWLFKNKEAYVEHYPYGVVGILGPSNLPFTLTIGDAIPALMAGNAVIIKPSEWTPRSALFGTKLAIEAGLPEGLLTVVTGGPEEGTRLVEEADCIFFTGSTAVGRKVAARCGELLKPCILELGGKAPMIILEDADIERAAQAALWGRFAHMGQHCIAVERILVDKKVEAPFLKELLRLVKNLKENDLSRLMLPAAPQHLADLIEDAVQKGATIAWQTDQKEKGPTILTNTDPSMRVLQEEAFGPLLPITTFDSVGQAIELANKSGSGLSAYIFTESRKTGLKMAKKLEAGSVAINDVMAQFMVLDAPFGGWKNSGLGTRHSAEGLLQFTRSKTTLNHRFSLPFCRKKEFWWFPYGKWSRRLLRLLVRNL
ncbi:MAG: aldehyde dehydrogenase family protein [Deltaproteobacteria bacterium]|nr:aldehyde dehydrogenase family protein [Deltaproteobacteria bacterium]